MKNTYYQGIRSDGRNVLRTNFETRAEAEKAIKDIQDTERHPFTYRVRVVIEETEGGVQ